MAKKKKKVLNEDELEDSLEIFQDESDRACAVLGAVHLDHLLGMAIIKNLAHGDEVEKTLLSGPTAPLSSFAARIDLAYAIGLIDKDTRHDLDVIRHIRNEFAHSLGSHYFEEDQSIADRCRDLVIGNQFAAQYNESHRSNLMQPRNLFIFTVLSIRDNLCAPAGVTQTRPGRVLMVKKIDDNSN